MVAYALAGTMDLDLGNDPIGHAIRSGVQAGVPGRPVAEPPEIEETVEGSVDPGMFRRAYAGIFDGDHRWQALDAPAGATFAWDPASTYVRRPPHLDGMPAAPFPVADIVGARVLVKLGDSITTDHISPAGAIPRDSEAGRYLAGLGVPRASSTPSPPAGATTRSWPAAPSPTCGCNQLALTIGGHRCSTTRRRRRPPGGQDLHGARHPGRGPRRQGLRRRVLP